MEVRSSTVIFIQRLGEPVREIPYPIPVPEIVPPPRVELQPQLRRQPQHHRLGNLPVYEPHPGALPHVHEGPEGLVQIRLHPRPLHHPLQQLLPGVVRVREHRHAGDEQRQHPPPELIPLPPEELQRLPHPLRDLRPRAHDDPVVAL